MSIGWLTPFEWRLAKITLSEVVSVAARHVEAKSAMAALDAEVAEALAEWVKFGSEIDAPPYPGERERLRLAVAETAHMAALARSGQFRGWSQRLRPQCSMPGSRNTSPFLALQRAGAVDGQPIRPTPARSDTVHHAPAFNAKVHWRRSRGRKHWPVRAAIRYPPEPQDCLEGLLGC